MPNREVYIDPNNPNRGLLIRANSEGSSSRKYNNLRNETFGYSKRLEKSLVIVDNPLKRLIRDHLKEEAWLREHLEVKT